VAKPKKVLEAMVKKKIKEVLAKHNCWCYMPVPGGFGASTIDFLCAKNGRMFGIEAKAPGKIPTKRQILIMTEMRGHNIPAFVRDGNIEELEQWIILDLD
jgi:hypothetical protein